MTTIINKNIQVFFPATSNPQSIENIKILIKVLRRLGGQIFANNLPEYLRNTHADAIHILTKPQPESPEKKSFLSQWIKPWSKKPEPSTPPPTTIHTPFSLSWDIESATDWQGKHLLVLSAEPNTPAISPELAKKIFLLLCDCKWLHKKVLEQSKMSERQAPFIYPTYKKELFHANQKTILKETARQALSLDKNTLVITYPEGNWTPPEKWPGSAPAMLPIPIPIHEADLKKRATLLHAADIYINPQSTVGFQHLTLQAMACGLPVLVSTHDLASEIVYSKQTILKTTSTDEVIERLQSALEQKDWLKAVGRQNSEVAVLCDENRYLKRLEEILQPFFDT